MPGTVTPTGDEEAGKLSTICWNTPATACGLAGLGVSMRTRSWVKSPTLRSTGAPLIPVPPKSIPKSALSLGTIAGQNLLLPPDHTTSAMPPAAATRERIVPNP